MNVRRVLCNLSDWPMAYIEGLRGVLKGGTVIPAERDAFTVIRSLMRSGFRVLAYAARVVAVGQSRRGRDRRRVRETGIPAPPVSRQNRGGSTASSAPRRTPVSIPSMISWKRCLRDALRWARNDFAAMSFFCRMTGTSIPRHRAGKPCAVQPGSQIGWPLA